MVQGVEPIPNAKMSMKSNIPAVDMAPPKVYVSGFAYTIMPTATMTHEMEMNGTVLRIK
jgi:hypothetical protein